MKESNSNSKNDIQKMSRLKKFGILRDFSCFGAHGELSVLLRNLKFYFDINKQHNHIWYRLQFGMLPIFILEKNQIDIYSVYATLETQNF